MTGFGNNAEGGANGVAVTSGNSGGASGTAFAFVNGTVRYDNTHVAHGSMALKFSPASGSPCVVQIGNPTGPLALGMTQYASAVGIYFTAFPTSQIELWRGDNASNGYVCRIALSTTGKLVLYTNNGTTGTVRWTSTQSIALNAYNRIEIKEIIASGTGGSVDCAFYPGDSLTATDSFSLGSIDTGTTPIQLVDVGKYGTDAFATDFWVDDFRVETSTTAFLGPVGNTLPTVDAGNNQNVAASVTVLLAAVASDPDGTIASYAWTWDQHPTNSPGTNTGITNPATANASFTSGALGSEYVLRCTVTDNSSGSAFDTVEVRVPVAGATAQRMVPINGTGVGAWTIQGGSANDGAALSDESDATFLQSPAVSVVEVTKRCRVTPGAAKATGILKEKLWTDTGTANCTIRLYEGATLRQTWTQAITSSIVEYSFTLAGATVSAITDWGNLYIEVGATS